MIYDLRIVIIINSSFNFSIASLQQLTRLVSTSMYNPKDKSNGSFVCYSDLYKDVYDRAIAKQNNKSVEIPHKIQPIYVKPQFIQIRSIGIGAASSVYLVSELKTKCIFAMKIIAKSAKLKQKQFLKEQFKIHLKLYHPNIVSVYHIYNDEGSLKLILQYAEMSLMDMMKQRIKLSEKQAGKIIAQILRGIDYIHQKGITHRDIKLQNILLIHGVVKICDFGLAKRQKIFQSQDLVGTIDYLSPQIVKEKKYTYKTDIWAVGIILWQLIHGVSTFLKQQKQSDKYMQLIKLNTDLIDYGNCSYQLRQFFKKIFTKQQFRFQAHGLLNQKFIVQSERQDRKIQIQL